MDTPQILVKIGKTSTAFTIDTKFLDDRIIFLDGVIDEERANAVIKQLLWLNSVNSSECIDLYINSTGGGVYQGIAIKDIIHKIDATVNTFGFGQCASLAAYLLSAGTGTRKTTKNCRIMIHSVSSQHTGNYNDLEVGHTETKYIQEMLMQDMAEFSKGITSAEDFKKLTQRDKYMSPEEAAKIGIIDEIGE